MKAILILTLLTATLPAFAQKGVDSQNKTIQKESTRTTDRGGDVSRTWDFGAGKTKATAMLPNPLRMGSRRDVLTETIQSILRESKMSVDAAASRISDGVIVTQAHVFAKGAVITRNELGRYGVISDSAASWTRARVTLTVEIQSIDGFFNNVSVSALVEGRSENGLLSEWNTLQSTGVAEDEFLRKLYEAVHGKSADEYEPRNP